MEAGKTRSSRQRARQARPDRRDGRRPPTDVERRRRRRHRALGLPHLRVVLGHVHRQLDELPHRGARALAARQRHNARHPRRPRGAVPAGRRLVVDLAKRYYEEDDESVLPREIAGQGAFNNAMALDIAMGGSTNTVLHLLAAALEGGVDFTMHDIDALPRVPVHVQGRPRSTEVPHGGRAPGRRHPRHPGRTRPRRAPATRRARRALAEPGGAGSTTGTSAAASRPREAHRVLVHAAPGGVRTTEAFCQTTGGPTSTPTRERLHPVVEHAYTAEGGLGVLYGNLAEDGCIVKTAGVDENDRSSAARPRCSRVAGRRPSRRSSPARSSAGDVVVVRYEGPKGGPGMQEMLYPTSYLKGVGPRPGRAP